MLFGMAYDFRIPRRGFLFVLFINVWTRFTCVALALAYETSGYRFGYPLLARRQRVSSSLAAAAVAVLGFPAQMAVEHGEEVARLVY